MEKTIEEKAKAYDELIKRLNKAREDVGGYTFKSVYDEVMSELAESEDERIRKEIIDFLELPHPQFVGKRDHEKWIAWLEKQGEQKSTEWSEEDEDILNTIINHFKIDIECTDEDDIVRWLKSFKDRVQPKQEWSEEDEKMIEICVGALRYSCYSIPSVEKAVNWLKSLRLQNTWKPSEEQMEALNGINVTGGVSYAGQAQELRDLYNDLKKLREK